MDNLNDLPINLFDVAVIGVLLISALLAYARGFVHETLSVGAWVGAIVATIYGFPFLQAHGRNIIAIELAADLATGTVIFVVSLAVLSILTRSIARAVKDSALNAVDRALGFLFGLARGAVIVCIAYIGLELVIPRDDQPAFVQQARSMELILPGTELLVSLVPERTGSAVSDAADDAKDKARDIMGTQKLVKEILTPTPKSGDTSEAGAYDDKERQDMQRLIENNQQQQ